MTKLRWAEPAERPVVQNYLFEKMGKIPHERWANILDCRWNRTDDYYGVIVEEKGEIAGFLGIVFADRMTNGQSVRTGNITSWYLEKHLRGGGLGQDMVEFVCQAEGVTYTATSANFRSGALLKKIGWDLMEDQRVFWHQPDPALLNHKVIITSVSQLDHGDLPASAIKILNDHSGLNFQPHLLVDVTGKQMFFITYMKLKGEQGTAHHEILHASDLKMLSDNISQIAGKLLTHSNSVLSCDRRFVAADVKVDDQSALEICRYYKPWESLPASQVDFLYGEVLLLDLKIY